MANPFAITPASPLQALMMGQQGYESGNKMRVENDRRSALQSLMGGGQGATGTPDYSAVANRLAQSGDLAGAAQVATIAKSLAGPESTDEIKEYKLAQGQGFKGSFFDFKTQLKQAGATRINNTVNAGENEYAKAVGKADADRFIGFTKAGQSAQGALTSLDVLERAVASPDFYSGPGAEKFVLPIRQATAAFGGDPNAAATMETFRANASKAALDSMGGSLGAGFSNADRDFVLNMVPNLGTTPEGNKQLINVSRKVKQREIQIAKMARDYAARNKGRLDSGFDDELAEYAAKNPLFPNRAPSQNLTGTGVKWRILD